MLFFGCRFGRLLRYSIRASGSPTRVARCYRLKVGSMQHNSGRPHATSGGGPCHCVESEGGEGSRVGRCSSGQRARGEGARGAWEALVNVQLVDRPEKCILHSWVFRLETTRVLQAADADILYDTGILPCSEQQPGGRMSTRNSRRAALTASSAGRDCSVQLGTVWCGDDLGIK